MAAVWFLTTAGVACSALALRREGWRGMRLLVLSVGFGPGVGLGIASFLVFFWRVIGLAAPGPLVFFWVGIVIVLALWLPAGASRGEAHGLQQSHPVMTIAAYLGMILGLGCTLNAFVAIRKAWPDGVWDAVAIYNVRARLFYERYDDFPSVLKQVSAASHPHYPLLFPGSIAAQYFLLGHYDPGVPIRTGLAIVIGLGMLLYAVLRESVPPAAAAAAAAAVWSLPIVWIAGIGQMADAAAAYYAFGAAAVLASRLEDAPGPRLPVLLGGFFLACLMWTKNEGVIMVAVLLGAFAVMQWKTWRRSPADAVRIGMPLIAGLIPGVIAIVVLKRQWAPDSGLHVFFGRNGLSRVTSAVRWWIPVREILFRLISRVDVQWWSSWGLLWPVAVAGFIGATISGRWKSSHTIGFWWAVTILTTLSWIPIYAVTPYNQMWHIGSSVDRLFLQIFPMALAATALALCGARD